MVLRSAGTDRVLADRSRSADVGEGHPDLQSGPAPVTWVDSDGTLNVIGQFFSKPGT